MFSIYLTLGFEHISDLNGYDHILFIISLCIVYLLKDWKKVLILVTAFTIGHSVTLALATLDYIKVSNDLIEFLIPVTIFISGSSFFFFTDIKSSAKLHKFKYFTALFFGLIHGMGFSNYLKAILGSEENIVMPLFAFNVGLELGQILIVVAYLLIVYLLTELLKVKRREFNLIISGAVLGISLIMMIERFPL